MYIYIATLNINCYPGSVITMKHFMHEALGRTLYIHFMYAALGGTLYIHFMYAALEGIFYVRSDAGNILCTQRWEEHFL